MSVFRALFPLSLALTACDPAPTGVEVGADLPSPPPLSVSASELYAGSAAIVRATGAPAGRWVWFVVSRQGYGAGPCPPGLGGQCFDVLAPHILGHATADGTGQAELSFTVPASLEGEQVTFQAVRVDGPATLMSGVWFSDVLGADCPTVIDDFWDEADAIRSCNTAADCGQVLTGTSCGCTRNWVARNNADTTAFYDLLAEAGQCGLGLVSTCDCPAANGYDCVQHTCTWNYVSTP